MNLPEFNAEASLSTKSTDHQGVQIQQPEPEDVVVPQRHIVVKCAFNADNEIHCGYHDYDAGVSVTLF